MKYYLEILNKKINEKFTTHLTFFFQMCNEFKIAEITLNYKYKNTLDIITIFPDY